MVARRCFLLSATKAAVVPAITHVAFYVPLFVTLNVLGRDCCNVVKMWHRKSDCRDDLAVDKSLLAGCKRYETECQAVNIALQDVLPCR